MRVSLLLISLLVCQPVISQTLQGTIEQSQMDSKAWNNQGLDYLNQRKYVEAEACFQRAIELAKQNGDQVRQNTAASNMSTLYELAGKREKFAVKLDMNSKYAAMEAERAAVYNAERTRPAYLPPATQLGMQMSRSQSVYMPTIESPGQPCSNCAWSMMNWQHQNDLETLDNQNAFARQTYREDSALQLQLQRERLDQNLKIQREMENRMEEQRQLDQHAEDTRANQGTSYMSRYNTKRF